MNTTPTFMIVPSLACQASCRYCFGPHQGTVMSERTALVAVEFIKNIAVETGMKTVSIVFHGGEPLLAPVGLWRTFLDELRRQLAGYSVEMSLQSNLWNLDDEFVKLFCDHRVRIGTSLDGPEELCDLTRGEGYFNRTWRAIQMAKAAGLPVSGIATITRQTASEAERIVKYFRDNGMSMVLHGAVAGLEGMSTGWTLGADEYADLIKGLFPWYVHNRKRIRIDTFDHYVRGMAHGKPGACTFRDCFGMFLSISPTGDITSCQRLAGRKEFSLGTIFDRPTLKELYESAPAKRQRGREMEVAGRCAGCEILSLCKGGCYYGAVASGDGVVDPLCRAYKQIYAFVRERLMEEMQQPENIAAVADRPPGEHEHPLLRKGDYISLAGPPHPAVVADNARRILAIHELGRTRDIGRAAQNLFERKICGEAVMTKKLLAKMLHDLYAGRQTLNNCYLHVTFDCNLRCGHCYARGRESGEEMATERFEPLLRQALAAEFEKIVVTGGEPLMHSERNLLLDICGRYRGRGSRLALRTNLTGDFHEKDFAALANAFDQIVVSVDGDAETHDVRRGAGTYANVVSNIETLAGMRAFRNRPAELVLACTMGAAEINGGPGDSVRDLGRRLGGLRVRFRPVLPLGRAGQTGEPVMCEGLLEHVSPEDMLKISFRPMITCGIGQNVFVRPDGDCHPCYAWNGSHTWLGNAFRDGLEVVLASPQFRRLIQCSVDTIAKCRDCEFRYLCGGACRAWGNQEELDLNAAPAQCSHLRDRAEKVVEAARRYLAV